MYQPAPTGEGPGGRGEGQGGSAVPRPARRGRAPREQACRAGRPAPELAGRAVILVDAGLATGASMRAAVLAVKAARPAGVVVAVPAAPQSTCRELSAMVDEAVCATTPSPF